MNKQIIKIGYVNYSNRLFSIDAESKWTKWIMARYDQIIRLEPDNEKIGNKKDVDVNIKIENGKTILAINYNPEYTIIEDVDLRTSLKIFEELPQTWSE